jgi:hypothetical protein
LPLNHDKGTPKRSQRSSAPTFWPARALPRAPAVMAWSTRLANPPVPNAQIGGRSPRWFPHVSLCFPPPDAGILVLGGEGGDIRLRIRSGRYSTLFASMFHCVRVPSLVPACLHDLDVLGIGPPVYGIIQCEGRRWRPPQCSIISGRGHSLPHRDGTHAPMKPTYSTHTFKSCCARGSAELIDGAAAPGPG